uniref:Uncharacterized protein n=1 Tax=Romanomermis culicivorax TaxID=13658 RepID=A0A915L5S3_ROMCU
MAETNPKKRRMAPEQQTEYSATNMMDLKPQIDSMGNKIEHLDQQQQKKVPWIFNFPINLFPLEQNVTQRRP